MKGRGGAPKSRCPMRGRNSEKCSPHDVFFTQEKNLPTFLVFCFSSFVCTICRGPLSRGAKVQTAGQLRSVLVALSLIERPTIHPP